MTLTASGKKHLISGALPVKITTAEAVEAGDLITLDGYKADGNDNKIPYAVASRAAASSVQLTCYLLAYVGRLSGGAGAGTRLYMSDTDGDCAEAMSTTFPCQVGVEVTATEAIFSPALFNFQGIGLTGTRQSVVNGGTFAKWFLSYPTGTSATSGLVMDVASASTLSSGIERVISVNYASTGAKTAGYVNCITVDAAFTTGTCAANVALETMYLSQTGNVLTGNVCIWEVYAESLGTGVANVMLLDIGAVASSNSASRFAFMRCKNNSGTARFDEVFYIEGTSNFMATNLFTFCGCLGASDLLVNAAVGGSQTYKLKVLYEATPGAGGTTLYIPLHTA